jgi:hypothetical protein
MSSRSRVLVAATLALTLTGAVSGGTSATGAELAPAQALNATAPVTIESAGFIATSDGEQLSITADSSAPLATMTAHLADATTTDTLTMQPPADGTQGGDSTWTAPVTAGTSPGDLPLGTYNVTVDVTFQDGTPPDRGARGGTVTFQETPSVTLTVDNPAVSYDHRHPTVFGAVTVTLPGATTAAPYARHKIVLDDSVQGDVTVTTDKTGHYSHTFPSPRPGETVTAKVPASSTVAGASSPNSITFTTHQDHVTMSERLSATTVTYGRKVSVRGTVRYAPGTGGLVPLNGQTVRIYDGARSSTPVATAVTDRTGHFTAALPKVAASLHWVLRASGAYLSTATSTLPMKVNLPTAITGFHATLSQYWQVSFHGCLRPRPGVPGSVPSLAGLTIQYAPRPGGPWHTLGAVARQTSLICGNGGRTFSGTRPARLNYAYYRAVYAGGTNRAGTGYLPAVSGKVLAWKYEDRITSFGVSARTVAKGGQLTVSGRLQYYFAKWRNYPGQQVRIILRPQGSKTWYYIAVAQTNSAGQFSATFTDPVSATWSAEYLGDAAHLAAVAAMIYVAVK